MNCRFSPIREKWFGMYEVPENIREECARGKTIDQIKEEHANVQKMRKENPELPSLIQRAWNYSQFLKREAIAKANGEETTVSQEVFEERLKICQANKCGKLNIKEHDDGQGGILETFTCSHQSCGCNLLSKLWKTVESCPMDEWQSTQGNG